MDGKIERIIQYLEDLSRACLLEQWGARGSYLSLIECTYNNSLHASIGIIPYKVLYRRWRKTPLCLYDSGDNVVLRPEIVQQTTEKIKMIQEEESTWVPSGSLMFFRVTLVTGVGQALKSRKLTPRPINPYQIL